MKKLTLLIALISFSITAQDYAQWSLEMSAGTNKIFSSIDESKNDIHLDMYGRYMFNSQFGLMVGLYYDKYRSSHSTCRYVFSAYKATIEGVYTLARLNNFTILAHGGIGGSYLQYHERVLNTTIGGTLLYRLKYWGALKTTIRTTTYSGLDESFDQSFVPSSNLTQAQSFSVSAGFVIYLDNHRDKPLHYDWYEKPNVTERVIEKQIDRVPNVVYNTCGDCVPKKWVYTLYFKEGQGCFDENDQDNLREIKKIIDKTNELDKPVIEYHLYSCHKSGTKESNKRLRLKRGKCTAKFIGKSGKIIDHGQEVKYKSTTHQRVVEVIISN